LEKLNTTIKKFLNNFGLTQSVNQNTAIILWDEVVGEKISKNTEPISVEHGTLTVSVSNPTWRQELVFKQQDIINQLNKKLGKNTIKEVRFI
jgi:predicted nucleic acid-binding Zn ribbon protein|tara:strand:- start:53 stop:328 length:276 start_codon:yes stop_codon:yes gene_type:complete